MRSQFQPTVSTVTPTYNRRELLLRAIEAIQRQTYSVAEIIVVDDGSTDGTAELVEELVDKDQRIKLIRQNRGGAPRARNAGVEAASGEWIAFLDSDDSWEPEKIAAQIAALAARPEAIASFTGLRPVNAARTTPYLPPDNPTLEQLRQTNVLSSTSTSLIRKDAFTSIGGFDPDLPSCQDWDLWFRLRKIGPFSVVREPLLLFTAGQHERISTNDKAVFAGHEIIFERLRSDLTPAERRRAKAGHDLTLADLYLKRGKASQAFKLARGALLANPSKWAARLTATALKRMVLGDRPLAGS